MSTTTREAQELLRLFKCAVDTGADVLVPFAKNALLKSYSGNFESFLHDKKHRIFHIWQSQKLLCCECPPAGSNLKQNGHMDNWIFKKLYSDSGNENKRHIVRSSGKVVQVCLHKYVTQNIGIHELDISALSFLLRNLAILSPNEITALDAITTCRSKICHAYSTNCYHMASLNITWIELENALVELTDPFYKVVIQKQIKYLRKVDLEKEEITELMKNVRDVNVGMEEVRKCVSHNNNAIQNVLEGIGELRANQASSNFEMSEKFKKIEKMIHMVFQINNTTFSVKNEQFEGPSEGEECLVLWQLATPENWKAENIEQLLKKHEDKFKDLPVKIKFVRKGSLMIMTTMSAKVLQDSTVFQSAVKAFLKRMVEVCKINTHVSCVVDVTLHILKSDELKVTCRLSDTSTDDKAVQTDSQSCGTGIQLHKQTLSKALQHDIAFINADNDEEIKWVQRARLGITCAIPGRDYLRGLPLDNLDIYYKKYRTVILTLTGTSSIAERYQIDKYDSAIVVELYNMENNPSYLRNIMHINGTICEHLWFSQLATEVRNRHLDLEISHSTTHIMEVPFRDCKKCISAASLGVYHTITFEAFPPLSALFCGNLISEPFIFDVCNNLANYKNFASVISWTKSTSSKIGQRHLDIAFVFVSKHTRESESLEEFIKMQGPTIRNFYSSIIEKTEVPKFIENYTTDIKAHTMEPDKIAALLMTIIIEKAPRFRMNADILPILSKKTVSRRYERRYRGSLDFLPGSDGSYSSIQGSRHLHGTYLPLPPERSLSSYPRSFDNMTFSGLGRRREQLPTDYTEVHDPHSKRKELKGTYRNPLPKGNQSPEENAKLEEPLL